MKNLILILDGLGYDQVKYFQPPYLTKLGEELGIIPLETLLAYSSGIYPAIYTGLYPDENGFWTEFIRRDLPMERWTSLFRIFPGKSFPRKLSYVAELIAKRFGGSSQANFVPPFLQNWFDRISVHYDRLPPIEIQSKSLITNLYQKAGKHLEYIYCEDFNVEAANRCIQASSSSHTIIFCITETDHAGHIFGPMSQAYGAALSILDNRLGEMLNTLRNVEPDFNLFIFSDHGMTSVTQKFDAWNYLEKCGFYLGKDYLAFINSTVMSLWLEKDNQDQIKQCLNQSGFGRVLTTQERQKYHLDFVERKYGDHFFIVNEGVELIPNFLSLAWKPNIGMHGYSPEYSSTRAFLIGSRILKSLPVDVVDLHNVIVDMA